MITSATVYMFLFIHLGVIIVVTSYYALSAAVAPMVTQRARARFARRPWLPVLLGAAVTLPAAVVALIAMNAPAGGVKFAGATLGTLLILAGLVGGAGMAQHIGRGRGDGAADATWVQTVRGGLFITLTWVLPLVGWLIMLPLTLCAGVGCLLVGMWPMRESRELASVGAG